MDFKCKMHPGSLLYQTFINTTEWSPHIRMQNLLCIVEMETFPWHLLINRVQFHSTANSISHECILIDQMPRLINAWFNSLAAHWFFFHSRCTCFCAYFTMMESFYFAFDAFALCFDTQIIPELNRYGTHHQLKRLFANSQTIKSKLHFLN